MGVRLLDKLTMLYKELEYYSKCNLKDEMAKRLETYKEQSLPLLDMYKDNIMNFEIHDASTPIKENLARVMNALDEVFKG